MSKQTPNERNDAENTARQNWLKADLEKAWGVWL